MSDGAGGPGNTRSIGDSASVRAWRLRRNVYLPVGSILVALAGFAFAQRHVPEAVFGWLAAFFGAMFAPLVLVRNAFRSATEVTVRATRDALTVEGISIPVADIVETKLVPRPSAHGDHVIELVLRDRSTLSLSTTLGGAAVILDTLGIEPGDRRTTFTTVIPYGRRFLASWLVLGVPWLATRLLDAPGYGHGSWSATLFVAAVGLLLWIAPIAAIAALALGLLRGKLVIGADGFTRRWLFWRRFVPFTRVLSVQSAQPLADRFIVDTVVQLDDASILRIRAYDAPDTGEQRGAESRALFRHLQQAHARSLERRAAGAETALLRRGDRSAKEWSATLRQLAGSEGAGYRVATMTPEALLDAVKAVDGPVDGRIGAAAALLRTGVPEHRTAVRVAAEACADPATRAILDGLLATDSDEDVEAVLERVRR